MRAGGRGLLVLGCVFGLAGTAVADPFPLQWTPQPQPLHYKVVMDRRQELSGAQSVGTRLRWEGEVVVTLTQPDEQTPPVADVRFTRIRVRDDGAHGSLLHDSASPQEGGAASRWAVPSGQLLAARIRIEGLEGSVSGVSPGEDWDERLQADLAAAGGTAEDGRIVVAVFGEAALERVLERFFTWLPVSAQQPGGMWTSTSAMDLPLRVDLMRESRYRLVRLRREQGGETALITVTDRLSDEAGDRTYALPGDLSLSIRSFSQSGEITFDRRGFMERRRDRGRMRIETVWQDPEGKEEGTRLVADLTQDFTVERTGP